MSSVAVIPPPNSTSLLRHLPRLTARARALLTAMNLHFAGVAALLVFNIYLIVHVVLVWQALNANNADALASQRASLRAAEIAAAPMRGLDEKLVTSTSEADKFYGARLPYAYSQVLTELGALTKKQSVRLVRVQYTQNPALSGKVQLTELRIDASVSGDYRPVVQFINATERDRMFFNITSIALSGQQTGQVNLRIRMVTYLRQPNDGEVSDSLPADATDISPDAPAGTAGATQITPATQAPASPAQPARRGGAR